MEKKYISQAVIKRIPRYYRYVVELTDSGIARISSKALAEKMGLTASQIRQDLNCFGGFGQQGYGYNVESLKVELEQILGVNKLKTAVIIGVGNIGKALTKNFHFERSGISLIAGFDLDEATMLTKNGPINIYNVDTVEEFVKTNNIDVGIITLPKELAEDMAKKLVNAGVKGIWNFTSSDLHLNGYGIPIENVHFSDSLRTLSYNMEQNN